MTFKVNTIPPKRLAETIDASATTFQISDILGFDGVDLTSATIGDTLYGSFQDTSGTILELFKIDTSTIASASITMSKRGLQFNEDGTETEVAANKLLWIKNQTIINLGTNPPALFKRFVDKVTDETVAGVKTFSSIPVLPASNPSTGNQATRKTYVDTQDATLQTNIDGKVSLTGNETVAGIKTFSSSPVVPTGGSGTQAANATDIANAITGASGTATNLVNGTLKLSVAAASAPDPIAVGDNDPRVPTQDENDALDGTGTPSSSNKYVTNDTLTAILKFGGTGADGALTLTSGATDIDLGGALYFEKNYTSISITGTGQLTFSNPHQNGTQVNLRSQGGITLTSSATPNIEASGIGGAGGAGAGPASNSMLTSGYGYGFFNTGAPSVKAYNGTNVGQHGASVSVKDWRMHIEPTGTTTNSGTTFGSGVLPALSQFSLAYPGGGGSGGAKGTVGGTVGNGGRGGGGLNMECAGALNFTSTIYAKGVAAAAADIVGGDGAGGQVRILCGSITANTGVITVTGPSSNNGSSLVAINNARV